MNTVDIQAALTPLVGLPLRGIGRAADVVWLSFGKLREIPAYGGGTKAVGQWVIHIQCPWRLARLGRIVVARHDIFHSSAGDYLDDWHTFGKSQFDSVVDALNGDFETISPVVKSVLLDDVGGFSLHHDFVYRLDVFPDASNGSTECWRIFQPGIHGPHFIVPTEQARKL